MVGAHPGAKCPIGIATGAIQPDALPRVDEDDRRMQLNLHHRRVADLRVQLEVARSENALPRNYLARHDFATAASGSAAPAGSAVSPPPVAPANASGPAAATGGGSAAVTTGSRRALFASQMPPPPAQLAGDLAAIKRWQKNWLGTQAKKARKARRRADGANQEGGSGGAGGEEEEEDEGGDKEISDAEEDWGLGFQWAYSTRKSFSRLLSYKAPLPVI